MGNSNKEIKFSALHQNIYNRILRAMTTPGRKKAMDIYGCEKKPDLRSKWEGYHLLEFAKSIHLPIQDQEERKRFDGILIKNRVNGGFEQIRKQPSENSGFQIDAAKGIFESLAEFQDIQLLVCFLNFLEFCKTGTVESEGPWPLYSVFEGNDVTSITIEGQKISMSLDELIADVKEHIERELKKLENTSNDNDKAVGPSAIQPRLTIKQAKANDINYYANATLKVIGREKEQKRLTDFLDCELNVAWFQLAGVAGQGKSRLAFELVNHAKNLGWNAGLLEENDIRFFDDQWQTWQPDRPHLIVFDYVVGREEKIKPILQTLAYRQGEFLHNIRILLVERQRWNKGISFNASVPRRSDGAGFQLSSAGESNAEWFLSLCQDNNYDGHDHTLSNSRFDNGAVELEKLNEDDLVMLVRQIAKHVSDKKLTIPDYEIKETLHHIDKSGRPLYAYFLGQELGYGTTALGWSNYDLLNAALSRERAKWWSAAFGGKPPLLEDDTPASRLALLATMTDGVNCREAHKNSLIPKANAELRRQALALTGGPLGNQVESPEQDIPSMQPDLLGEWFVIASFDADDSSLEEITAIAWRYAPEKMGAFMQRLYQDFPTHPSVIKMLDCLDLDEIDINALSKVANVLLIRLHQSKLVIDEKVIRALHINAESGDPQSINILGTCYQNGFGMKQNVDKAFVCYEKAAESGNTKAMINLGFCYEKSIGVTQDIDKAFAYYEKATIAGDTAALVNLGECYRKGIGVTQDIAKAVAYYEKAAEAGNKIALNNLGECYMKGIGVMQDFGKAAAYFHEAAELGLVPAMFKLGVFYQDGVGVAQDIDKAVAYFEKAAEAGDALALVNLGDCYFNGTGKVQDFGKAATYFERAAEAGIAIAMVNLGNCYLHDTGVARDVGKAIAYYEMAAEAGNTDAMIYLGCCYQTGTDVTKDIGKAFMYLEKAAEEGDTYALRYLGNCYTNGADVVQDEGKAIAYYEKAAKAGDAEAMLYLCSCYQHGTGVAQDVDKALAHYEKSAEAGNTDAMVHLGAWYESGTNVEQDVSKAFAYYEKAAKAGDASAMVELGFCYQDGIGVAQDMDKAVTWYEKAAEAGSSQAMFNLGVAYEIGISVPQNMSISVSWYEKAAEAGNTAAMENLGIHYENGNGVAQNVHKAFTYYERAAEAGSAIAMFKLGFCYTHGNGVAQNAHKAVAYYEKAAEAGIVTAVYNLGVSYRDGDGVTQDMDKAVAYFQKAAEADDAKANFNLGVLYENGTGVTQDVVKAVAYYTKAVEAGVARAMVNLGLCYQNGTGVAQNKYKAVSLFEKAAEVDEVDEVDDAKAIYNLGVCYRDGIGVTQDEDKAVMYFQKAAESGNTHLAENQLVLTAKTSENFIGDLLKFSWRKCFESVFRYAVLIGKEHGRR